MQKPSPNPRLLALAGCALLLMGAPLLLWAGYYAWSFAADAWSIGPHAPGAKSGEFTLDILLAAVFGSLMLPGTAACMGGLRMLRQSRNQPTPS